MNEIVRILGECYGLNGDVSQLAGDTDGIFKLSRTDQSYSVRISPKGTDPYLFGFQAAVLDAFADSGITAPTLIETIDGERQTSNGDGQVVRVFSWVEGRSFVELGRPPKRAKTIGRMAGRAVKALEDVKPQDRTTNRWNLIRASETIGRYAPSVENSWRRDHLERIAHSVANANFAELPHQVIHGDLNDDNILFADNGEVGVIDVGDAAWSIRIGEAAIAATYAMLDQDDPITVAGEVLAGFGELAEITEEEATAFFDLILGRLATSLAISGSRPPDAYHHRSEDLAWDLLERLMASDQKAIRVELTEPLLGEATSTVENLGDRRRQLLGPSLSLSYERPLNIVRGSGSYLFSHRGRRFLDCVNNVAHVGHAHPRVVAAATRQTRLLNTNTRYLHEEILRYGERLAAKFPDHLDTVFLVNSGSEANELAIRLARAATGRRDIACLEHGYHGNTSTLIDLSHYKFAGPGGEGEREWVITLPCPDPYRSPEFKGADGLKQLRRVLESRLDKRAPAALIAESLPGVAGQIRPEARSLEALYDATQKSGAVVIADEVQAGFGRVGAGFWSFQLFDVSPDIVTMGKPIGNGHPLGAVVTTRAIADGFNNGMEYFNTFGGNPVSAAVGNAVLDVIEDENLQENAMTTGALLKTRLTELMDEHPIIGDARGEGLFLGFELVHDRDSKTPAPDRAEALIEYARDHGVLLSVDGPLHNVIKIKPPMVFSGRDADRLLTVLDSGLKATGP